MTDMLCWIIGTIFWLLGVAIFAYMLWPLLLDARPVPITTVIKNNPCNIYNTWVGEAHWPDHPTCYTI